MPEAKDILYNIDVKEKTFIVDISYTYFYISLTIMSNLLSQSANNIDNILIRKQLCDLLNYFVGYCYK